MISTGRLHNALLGIAALTLFLFIGSATLSGAQEKGFSKKSEIYKNIYHACETLNAAYREKAKIPAEKKINIAVVDFTTTGEKAKKQELGKGLAELINGQMTKIPGIKVIDRNRMEKIVQELQLSMSGLVDDTQIKQAGRMLAADLLLSGSISELGGNYSI